MLKTKLRFEVTLMGLTVGLISAVLALAGFFIFLSIISGRLSFAGSPYPRQDRAFFTLLSWILITFPFILLAPNKSGLTSALGVFIGLYLAFAYSVGSIYVFDSSAFMETAIGVKLLIAPIYFIVVLIVLLYNAVSGQEFFRSVIFGGFAIGFLAAGALLGIVV